MKRPRYGNNNLEAELLGGGSSFQWIEEGASRLREEEGGGIALETIEAGLPGEEEEKEFWEPCPLPSRKRERKLLKKPGKRNKCFLCAYIGEKETVIPSDDVNKIVEMLRKNTGRMDTVTLAEMIADYYANFRRKINAALRHGERPLPEMSASTVVDHIRRHHQDPEVKQVILLEELQELRECAYDVILEKSSKRGHKRINKTQVDALEKIVKLELLVQKQDASKMAFYSAGARLDPTTHKQGPVVGSTKTLFDFWASMR